MELQSELQSFDCPFWQVGSQKKTLTVQKSKTGQERNHQFLVINQHAT